MTSTTSERATQSAVWTVMPSPVGDLRIIARGSGDDAAIVAIEFSPFRGLADGRPIGEHADDDPLLRRAVAIAEQQHAGQVDKAGQPYIEHPKRVMQAMENDAERIVAILHDVIEDGDVTLAQLAAEGFPHNLLAALDAVTRRQDETYEAFVARAAADPIGRRVKRADLRDNADLTRIASPTAADLARTEKYRRALEQIDGAPTAPPG